MSVQAIVYTSNTGFTARYATLLGERTGLPVQSLEGAALPPGTEILYLGWLCAGSIKGLKKAARRFSLPAVCAVGMAPPDPAYSAKIARQAGLGDRPLFYLRGGYAPQCLTGLYRPMMAVMTRHVTKTPARTTEEQAMQDAFLHGGDWVSEEALAPVLNWLEAAL